MSTVSVSLPSDGQTADAADYNVPINTIVSEINGNLNSQNIAAGGVIPNSLTSGTGTSWAWQSWTPTITNFTLGNGTLTSKYIQIGKTVIARLSIVFGSTTAVSGSVTFTLPVTSVAVEGGANNAILGDASFYDAATAITRGWVAWASTTTGLFQVGNSAGTYVVQNNISATVPSAMGTGNANKVITARIYYEAA